MLKLLVLCLCVPVDCYRPRCDKQSVLRHLHIPTNYFSVRILDRISQETDGHFVFSPISTWLQLVSLSEGANGTTLTEILKNTRHYQTKCLRKLVKDLFNSVDKDLRVTLKHRSVIVIDDLLEVKPAFVNQVENLNAVSVLNANFRTRSRSAHKVNDIIKNYTNGTFTTGLYPYDFIRSVLLMIDAACMKANWKTPFNPVYTKIEKFYSYQKVLVGHVKMMNQIGYFRTVYIPVIDAITLELPFNDRLTMLFFLPTKGTAADLFWSMHKIRLHVIFKYLKSKAPRLVNVKIPRFKVTSDVENIPEILYDMGIQKMFFPGLADLKKISNYNIYVSMMITKADIEVTETGVSGTIGPDLLLDGKNYLRITFNRPFAYLVVDKVTNVIFFAGVYSEPSLF